MTRSIGIPPTIMEGSLLASLPGIMLFFILRKQLMHGFMLQAR